MDTPLILLDPKTDSGAPMICHNCGDFHNYKNKCKNESLMRMVSVQRAKIAEIEFKANKIDDLMKTNRQLVDTSNALKELVKQSSTIIESIEQTCKEFPNGQEVWNRFTMKMGESWHCEIINPDINEPVQLFLPGFMTQSESEDKPCTKATTGEPTQ